MQKHIIEIRDEYRYENNDAFMVDLVFELKIVNKKQNMDFSIELLAWSNQAQKNVLLQDSIYSTETSKKLYTNLKRRYKNIADNFLNYLEKKIKSKKDLELFLHYVKNPKLIFHKKLLYVFSQETLQMINKKYFSTYPILDIEKFEKEVLDISFEDIFLPHYIDGWYIDGIEVSTDLDKNPFPLIENLNNGKTLTPDEMLNMLKIY